MELPQLQPCNSCGRCCMVGGVCECRPWLNFPKEFTGRCEILKDEPDGTTSCRLIALALSGTSEEHSLWAAHYLDGKCEWPEHRKEICAPVHA